MFPFSRLGDANKRRPDASSRATAPRSWKRISRRNHFRHKFLLREVLRVQSNDKGSIALLRACTDCVVVRIRRHIAFFANIHELCLLTQQIDDLPDEMPSYAKPRENPLVFRKNILRYKPDEGFMLKPITKK